MQIRDSDTLTPEIKRRSSPSTPPSFRINPDGSIQQETVSKENASESTSAQPFVKAQSKPSSSHHRMPQAQGEIEQNGCSCLGSFGFRSTEVSCYILLRSDAVQNCSHDGGQDQHQTCSCSGITLALTNCRHSRVRCEVCTQ
jgi:hypothetical protein